MGARVGVRVVERVGARVGVVERGWGDELGLGRTVGEWAVLTS